MAKRKSYNYISKLVYKITSTDCPNNVSFGYYGNKVYITSGQQDYMSVSINDRKGNNILYFSFDYLTMKLIIKDYENIKLRDKLLDAFKEIYGRNPFRHLALTDEPLENDIKDQERFIQILTEMGDKVDEITLDEEKLTLDKLRKERDTLYSIE